MSNRPKPDTSTRNDTYASVANRTCRPDLGMRLGSHQGGTIDS